VRLRLNMRLVSLPPGVLGRVEFVGLLGELGCATDDAFVMGALLQIAQLDAQLEVESPLTDGTVQHTHHEMRHTIHHACTNDSRPFKRWD
jgi:hypothetical protein